MTHPPAWPLVDSRSVLETRVFRVSEDRARAPRDGAEHVFHRMEAPDWVNVVPVTEDGRYVLVRQYRHGARRTTLEIPGGMVDPGESSAEAAARELCEETGYGRGALSYLGVVNPNPALFANRCFTYLAAGVERVGEVANEGSEDTRVVLATEDELAEHVARGEIDHALVIAALFFHDRRRRGLAGPPRP
jgi:ADP-ribose pyrophosphatase